MCEEEQGSAGASAIAIVRCMMVFFKVKSECAFVFVKASMDSRMAYRHTSRYLVRYTGRLEPGTLVENYHLKIYS